MLGVGNNNNPFSLPPVLDHEEQALLTTIKSDATKIALTLESLRGDNPALIALFEKNYLRTAAVVKKSGYNLDLNQVDALGYPFILHVCDQQDLNWFRWLISQAHDVNLFAYSSTGQNIYHASAHIKEPLFLASLFAIQGEIGHLFKMSDAAENPLMMAIEFDNENFFLYYLRNFKSQTLEFKDKQKQNILHLIAQHNAIKCFWTLKKILSEGEWSFLESARNIDCEMPLLIAAKGEDRSVYDAMMGYQKEDNQQSLLWMCALGVVTHHLKKTSLSERFKEEIDEIEMLDHSEIKEAEEKAILTRYDQVLPTDLCPMVGDAVGKVVKEAYSNFLSNQIIDQTNDIATKKSRSVKTNR